ncbi:TPA: cysteine desulfurase [bacterium]|nr:cysteine desulfurase [bacterium]
MNDIYLDYASTTPINKEVLENYIKLINNYFANADSNHRLGGVANNYLKRARERIANILGVKAKEIIFTSGSSEANNLAIKGVSFAYKSRGKHLITSKVEHSSVLDCFKQLESEFGFEVTYLNVNKDGSVSLSELKDSLRKDTILVSLMAVNNEIGSINNISEIASIVKENSNAFLHVDATQAIGKETIDYSNVDLYNFSAHKIYGLKGSGVLVKREKVRLSPQIIGGQQENNLRGGTSNWQTSTMMAKTLRLALDNQDKYYSKVKEMNSYLRENLSKIEGIHINSSEKATPFILNFAIKNKKGEVLLNALSNRGIYLSSKSACSSYSSEMSPSVYEVSKDEFLSKNSLRVSLSHLSTYEELDYFIESLDSIIKEVK